jgi:hypothetical protein
LVLRTYLIYQCKRFDPFPFHIPEIYKERDIQETSHKKFTGKFGGKVFYIYSIKEDGKKKIYNSKVIQEIQEEIERLEKSN